VNGPIVRPGSQRDADMRTKSPRRAALPSTDDSFRSSNGFSIPLLSANLRPGLSASHDGWT